MKRLFSVFFCCLLLLGSLEFPIYVLASSYPEDDTVISETVEALPDGKFLVITISEEPTKSRGTSYSKSGSKTYSLRNSGGDILWQFKVTGIFLVVEGSSSECTSVTHSYSIIDDDWNYVSGSSHMSGNQAIGNAEFNRKLLFITVETKTCDVTLTCDKNGNLS